MNRGTIRILTPIIAALLVAAFVLSLIVFFRASEWLEGNHLLEVVVWQLATWAPWALFALGVTWASEAGVFARVAGSKALLHAVASIGVAMLHIIWFRFVSAALSPYVVLEAETLYGVFAWFFVFWFILDVFVYWAILIFVMVRNGSLAEQGFRAPSVVSHIEEAGTVTSGDGSDGNLKPSRWLTVRTGDASSFIRPEDVMWVEAQGDYAVLHLDNDKFWVNETIGDLEKLLATGDFVRIHRSTIVNLEHLDRVEKAGPETGSLVAVISGGARRAVSRQGKGRLDALTISIS